MKKFKKPQLLILGIGGFLIVLLFFLPRTGKKAEEKTEDSQTVADYSTAALDGLDVNSRSLFDAISARINSESDPLEKIALYDSLSHFWEERNQLILAGDALMEIAGLLQDKPSYFVAGDKYFEAFQADSATNRKAAIQKAISSYEKVMELFPEDLEAATSLGVCYVEGAAVLEQPPMKGIQMLRDVLEKDPENINALVNLGYFAVKSGQFDKAIERFEEILEIQPEYLDAYLYLSDIYLKTGEKNKSIEQLEKYKSFLEEPEAIRQLEDYIEKLKNSNV